jgi:hypothetical protein
MKYQLQKQEGPLHLVMATKHLALATTNKLRLLALMNWEANSKSI